MTVARNPALAPASAARAPAAASPSTPMIVLGLGLLLALVLLRLESPIPEAVRFRAGVLWMLYLLPTALYASRPRSQQRPLPTVAILGIVHATYYALPPLAGIVNAAYRPDGSSLVPYVDPVHDLPAAIDVALWGWVMFLVGYTVATLLLPDRRGVKHPLRVVPLVRALWIVAAAGLAIESLGALANVPIMFAGTAGFVALAGRYALTVLLALKARRALPTRQGKYLAACIIAELVLLATSGSMANPLLFALTLSFGFWIGGGRFGPRLLAGIFAAAFIAVVLKGIAADYRARTWWVQEQLTPIEETGIMAGLLRVQVEEAGFGGAIMRGADASMRRSATLDLLADVIRRTPSEVPHWGGQTYYSLIGSFVPRFLWPGKPTKNIGNQFGHRYGYLGSWDRYTAVNMPYMLEFYANFGFVGVALGMFLTALIVRLLDVSLNRRGSGLLRAAAAFIIIHPIFLIESDFSLVFGGLIMNGAALLLLVKILERRAAPAARGWPHGTPLPATR